ncbi:protein FAM228B-like isoform X2 [Dreissena polymorpha]|uniref:protein FAM228B-like isoform X2 n=1 Tax=Dreissena polymorpha TaxID=45954 RepID=UPI0022640758|nr:protein FAM228B-like isoform X2 [Dreissena polymorpha]
MTSMLCRKEFGGQVRVHDGSLVEELTVDDNDQIRTLMKSKRRSANRRINRPNTTPSPARSLSRNMDSQSLIGQTMKVQDWLNEKTVKTLQIVIPFTISNRAEEKSDLESKAARQLYSPLLQTENTFVKDVEDFISHRELTNLRKKEVLHKNWNERVYKPLRKKIIEAMDSNDWPEVDRRKRELHRQYLEFTNEKGHVFLDTMDPEEYYAMALNGHRPAPIKETKGIKKSLKTKESTIYNPRPIDKPSPTHERPGDLSDRKCGSKISTAKIETRPLHDPLISQSRQRNEEDRTILRCLTGYRYSDQDIEQVKMPAMPLVPLGRHGTDSIRWLQMPLSNIESTPRMASRKRMIGKFNNTDINFEQWSRTPYNHEAVDKELQIQKKRQYSEDQKPPFRYPLIRLPPKLYPRYPRSVSFQDPLVQEIPIMTMEPLDQSVQHMSLDAGGE